MTELSTQLTRLLAHHMPEILARSVWRRATTSLDIPERDVHPEHLPALRRQLTAGIRLFVEGSAQATLLEALDELCAAHAPPAHEEKVPIFTEAHVSRARNRARDLAAGLGGNAFVAQRAATVASELARNIVAYAQEGVLMLIPRAERSVLSIVAQDAGPGIADPEAVLNGSYRSRTGLGMGLRGVRRLAEHFDLSTGPEGTRVEVDITI
jgi:serine/threonine-protein kinase RsbT